jgi:hypothetical protein
MGQTRGAYRDLVIRETQQEMPAAKNKYEQATLAARSISSTAFTAPAADDVGFRHGYESASR